MKYKVGDIVWGEILRVDGYIFTPSERKIRDCDYPFQSPDKMFCGTITRVHEEGGGKYMVLPVGSSDHEVLMYECDLFLSEQECQLAALKRKLS